MASLSENRNSAEIEREIEADRRRIEEKIEAIQQRMSPGQLVDEVLAYTKSSGGGEYMANLGNAFKNNPVPAALLGVSLAWLMAGPKTSLASYAQAPADDDADDMDYPLAPVQGEVRRVGVLHKDGSRYSHFADSSGKSFKALTDETGRRAGHFMDESGKVYRGFADAAGEQVSGIRDEAGRLLDEALGWTSKTWRQLKSSAGGMGSSIASAGRSSLDASAQMNDAILKHFKDQPLIGGALAFAVGAAIGAALPPTRKEDETLGAAADNVKSRLSDEAAKAMDKAEHVASDVYGKAVSVAGEVHDVARDRIVEEAKSFRNGDSGSFSSSRPH